MRPLAGLATVLICASASAADAQTLFSKSSGELPQTEPQAKALGVDVSPHAGVGVTNIGGSAEAGAMLQLSQRQNREESATERLKALGLRDGARFGDRGRWYLFAAASGRAVGMNMLRTQD